MSRRTLENAYELRNSGLKAASSHPLPGAPDPLGALGALSGEVRGISSSKQVDVVVMSSMLGRLGGESLSRLTPAMVPALVAKVRASAVLPECRGWRLYVVGPGVSASGAVSDETGLSLRRLWSELVSSCGGTIVAWTASLEGFPLKGALPPLRVERRSVSITLPAQILFLSGSARLRASSTHTLASLATLLEQTYPGDPVTLAGYCDDEPTSFPGGNEGLSLARAEGVDRALARLGVGAARLRPVGYGASRFVATNATATGRAANRRVVVTVHLG